MTRVHILDVPVNCLTRDDVLERVREMLDEPRPHMIATVNPEMLVEARRDKELLEILQKTDLNVADGMGVALVARFSFLRSSPLPTGQAGSPTEGRGERTRGDISTSFVRAHSAQDDSVAERFPGVDLMLEICRICAEKGRSVYLIGGREGSAEKAAEVLVNKFPGLKVVGVERGPIVLPLLDKEGLGEVEFAPTPSYSPSGMGSIVTRIVAAKPDVLFAAFGHGKQEKWLYHNFLRTAHHTLLPRIAMGVGGAFDMLAGVTPRAPLLMRKIGLEWLWRLILEPRRWRRILKAVFVFPWLVLCTGIKKQESRITSRLNY